MINSDEMKQKIFIYCLLVKQNKHHFWLSICSAAVLPYVYTTRGKKQTQTSDTSKTAHPNVLISELHNKYDFFPGGSRLTCQM